MGDDGAGVNTDRTTTTGWQQLFWENLARTICTRRATGRIDARGGDLALVPS